MKVVYLHDSVNLIEKHFGPFKDWDAAATFLQKRGYNGKDVAKGGHGEWVGVGKTAQILPMSAVKVFSTTSLPRGK